MLIGAVSKGVPSDPPNPPEKSSRHIVEIESVRGLAALMVASSHVFSLMQLGPPRTYGNGISPWLIDLNKTFLVQGLPFVCLFFVLSGYVLGVQYGDKPITLRTWWQFAVRRLIRLFPPVWASVLLACVAFLLAGLLFELN